MCGIGLLMGKKENAKTLKNNFDKFSKGEIKTFSEIFDKLTEPLTLDRILDLIK